MSIRIEIMADSVSELVSVLQQMAANLSATASVVALDTAQQITEAQSASSGDLEDAHTGSVKRKGRPPKAKDDVPPEPSAAEPDEAPAPDDIPEPHIHSWTDEKRIAYYVNLITEQFKNGDEKKRAMIREWRDTQGLATIKELRAEHIVTVDWLFAKLGLKKW